MIKKIEPCIGVNKWLRVLEIGDNHNIDTLYQFIFKYLEENKLRSFRWELLQYIVPTTQLLFQWKIANNKQCNYCKQVEDYCHYFITCPFLLNFLRKMYEVLRKSRL